MAADGVRHSRDRMGKTEKERCGMKKKRILCSLLTLAMLMALLTVTAFAEGEEALTLPPRGRHVVLWHLSTEGRPYDKQFTEHSERQ